MNPDKLIDAAFDVCTALDRVGVRAVLTGGSAATFYAPLAYQSDDIDFVLVFGSNGKAAPKALSQIGFEPEKNKQHYVRNGVMLEFPKGPLSIGGDVLPDSRYSTERRAGKVLYVLTPTDAVCNRLESYFAWNDFSARSAAVAIVLENRGSVNLQDVKSWTLREYDRVHDRQKQRYNDFLSDLRHAGATDLPENLAM